MKVWIVFDENDRIMSVHSKKDGAQSSSDSAHYSEQQIDARIEEHEVLDY